MGTWQSSHPKIACPQVIQICGRIWWSDAIETQCQDPIWTIGLHSAPMSTHHEWTPQCSDPRPISDRTCHQQILPNTNAIKNKLSRLHGPCCAINPTMSVAPSTTYQLITSLQSNPSHRPRTISPCWCYVEILTCDQPTSSWKIKHAVSLTSKGSCSTILLTKNDTPSIGYQLMISHQSIFWEGSDA